MEEYKKLYQTTRWKKLRQAVYERDNGICYFCHKLILKRPNVHHKIIITKDNAFDESVFFNPDNLVVCHHSCHNAYHERFGQKLTLVDDNLEVCYERRKV